MIKVADEVIACGFMKLKSAFQIVSPNVSRYKASEARRKLLRMPLACVGVGDRSKGTYCLYIVEKQSSVNYPVFQALLQKAMDKRSVLTPNLSSEELKELLYLAESESEKEMLKYVAVKASVLSNTKAREVYKINDVQKCKEKLDAAVNESKAIRESIEKIASLKDKALLSSFGFQVDSESDLSESESEFEVQTTEEDKETSDNDISLGHGSLVRRETASDVRIHSSDDIRKHELQAITNNGNGHQPETDGLLLDPHQVFDILKLCSFNWFEFVAALKSKFIDMPEIALSQLLLDVGDQLSTLNLDEEDMKTAEHSRQAFLLSEKMLKSNEDEKGIVVSESDSSDQEIWNRGISNVLGESGREIITKRRAAIHRKAIRKAKKKIMERRFLKRRQSKKVSRILSQVPDIGKENENFVKDCGAGADAWRRTGVITFDGNRKVKKKPTFKRVKEHLEEKFQLKISYGSVVQLCVARNKRRRSAARYKGIAKVQQKRARKGFNVKFNPDEHWSAAFYGALDDLQFRDGEKVLNLGRDDQAGFRLDTMATHRQHGTLCVQGSEHLTTRTDYANKYPSTLQVTSYNFPETASTAELCAGVVKARGLHIKNAAQHLADIEMLSTNEELRHAFFDSQTNEFKEMEFIRVDGGHDEGPAHCETQYWWTVHHLKSKTAVTLVTSRNSGASYRNRVELQNGCLALAHANLFIPSTLNGSCISDSGKVDQSKLQGNLSSAIDVYINRVDGAPCASTENHVFRGADSEEYQKENTFVKMYLKGTVEAKEQFKKEHPEMYERINQILKLQARHHCHDVPTKYIFYLRCCYDQGCIHPRCKQGRPEAELTWYPGGPLLSFVPLPSPDPARPFGQDACPQCKSGCSGHYLKPEPLKQAFISGTYKGVKPPSEVLLSTMKKLKYEIPNEEHILEISKKVLLSPEETRMWCVHLRQVHENRVRGAKKRATNAASKKKASKKVGSKTNPKASPNRQLESNETEVCLECDQQDPPGTLDDSGDVEVLWICCDGCNKWCHASVLASLTLIFRIWRIGYAFPVVKVGTCREVYAMSPILIKRYISISKSIKLKQECLG